MIKQRITRFENGALHSQVDATCVWYPIFAKKISGTTGEYIRTGTGTVD